MRLNNFALLALCAVVSIATAVAVLALDHAGIIKLSPAVEHAREQTPLSVPVPVAVSRKPDAAERFALASLDTAAQPEIPAADETPPADEAAVGDEPPPTDESKAAEEPQLTDEPQVAEEEQLRGTVESDIPEVWSAEVQQEIAEPSDEEQKPDTAAKTRQPQSAKPRMTSWSRALTKRLAEISPGANARLASKFNAAGAAWPPNEIALVAIKDEKLLELFARPEGGEWKFVHRYPVLAASGRSGPKLRQGDKQVPEGVYGISFLNPNSRYHVSLRVNYPNAFDRRMAEADGRTNLGGDIMIHGNAKSVGCLAIGDEAAEELFVLAANVGLPNIKLIIAPTDFRRRGLPAIEAGQPKWVPELYTEVATAMAEFKSPPRNSLLSFFFGN